MRSTLLKFTLAAALSTASLVPVHAAVVLTYDGLGYWLPASYDESGFRTSHAGGLGNRGNHVLGIWAGTDVVIRAIDDSAFSLQSIDFMAVDELLPSFDVIGELAGGGTTVQHVSLDARGFQTVSFGADFGHVVGIRFAQNSFATKDVYGFDNVRLGAAVAAVPEPASGALVAAALLGAALSRRRAPRAR